MSSVAALFQAQTTTVTTGSISVAVSTSVQFVSHWRWVWGRRHVAGGSEVVDRVLAIGLDGVEISLARQMMAEGELPALSSAGGAQRPVAPATLVCAPDRPFLGALLVRPVTGGRRPFVGRRVRRLLVLRVAGGRRFAPFFDHIDGAVVLDAPYGDFTKAREARGALAWAAHDPGLAAAQSRPTELLEDSTRTSARTHGRESCT